MPFTTLVSTGQLARNMEAADWAIVDCRFSLQDTERGRRDYRAGHIPGAVYAHLDKDLSGAIIPGRTSRHPLPEIEDFVATASAWGIDGDVQVVAYDDMGGAMAARLWWMLRWLGHDAVAVLDGGWPRWQAEQRPAWGGEVERQPRTFVPNPQPNLLASTAEVEAMLGHPDVRLVDARVADRYRGENESLDPVAGHIPGALNAPFAGNLAEDGSFLPAQALRERYRALLGDTAAEQTLFYCGSGVTAAHNVLAFLHAGLGQARLYAGSWSEWITDPRRPVEKS